MSAALRKIKERNRAALAERDRRIAATYREGIAAGRTLATRSRLSVYYGITHERVRQIALKHGIRG